jgi:hypothetical protein
LWTKDLHCYIPGRLKQTLGIATICQFTSSITAQQNQGKAAKRLLVCIIRDKYTDWTAFMEKVMKKIMEVKTHNGWKREGTVKGRYENFIQIIKGKLEDTTPKPKQPRNWRTTEKRK